MKIWEILKPENIGKVYTLEDNRGKFKVIERYPYDGTGVSLNIMGYEEHIEDEYHLDFILRLDFKEVE